MKIISRKEALQAGLTRYFTGQPCLHEHVTERRTDNSTCTECDRTSSHAWYKTNLEKARACRRAWKKANPEKHRALNRAWKKANPEKTYAHTRAYRKANPTKYSAYDRARAARELNAMPTWACKQSIQNVYAEAFRLTKSTSIPHHVDHIVPLKGKNVCGLHVHYNLQAIPAAENIKKSNRFDS